MKYFSSCRDSRPVERNSANNPFQLIEREKVETKCKPCHWTTAMSLSTGVVEGPQGGEARKGDASGGCLRRE